MDTNRIIAYSPLLPLAESHVGIYKIYVLKNPFTQEVFYIGQTMQNIEMRLVGHLAGSESNKEKVEYIQDIVGRGGKPIIETIETIATTCFIDKMAVNEREIYWIRYYKSLGCSLLNKSAIAPDTKCKEYHVYLSAIKQGKTSYHYYYCGTTVGGMRVYDEKRLRADGFRLPDPEPEPINEPAVTIEPYYNPYNSKLFRLKNNIPDEEENKIQPVVTEIFPLQPSWSKEFAAEIPHNNIFEDLGDGDIADYEPEPLEEDLSDFEPNGDEENEPDLVYFNKESELTEHPIIKALAELKNKENQT